MDGGVVHQKGGGGQFEEVAFLHPCCDFGWDLLE